MAHFKQGGGRLEPALPRVLYMAGVCKEPTLSIRAEPLLADEGIKSITTTNMGLQH